MNARICCAALAALLPAASAWSQAPQYDRNVRPVAHSVLVGGPVHSFGGGYAGGCGAPGYAGCGDCSPCCHGIFPILPKILRGIGGAIDCLLPCGRCRPPGWHGGLHHGCRQCGGLWGGYCGGIGRGHFFAGCCPQSGCSSCTAGLGYGEVLPYQPAAPLMPTPAKPQLEDPFKDDPQAPPKPQMESRRLPTRSVMPSPHASYRPADRAAPVRTATKTAPAPAPVAASPVAKAAHVQPASEFEAAVQSAVRSEAIDVQAPPSERPASRLLDFEIPRNPLR